MTHFYKSVSSTGKTLSGFTLRLLLLFAALVMTGKVSMAQVDVTGAAVGNGSYSTLSAAFAAINGGSQTGSSITIAITANTTEPAGGAILNAGTWTSLQISPSGGSWSITGAATAGSPLVDLNGADNVLIDGLNTGGNALTISNTTVSATSGTSTIRLQGDAVSNIITNCSILGSATMAVGTNGGNIWIGAASVTTGNDNNTISNCNIGPAGTNLNSKGVYINGSTAALTNSGNIITNNNIFDFFNAGTTSAGVYFAANQTDNTISNNRFYQTATRVQTSGAQHSAIWITNTSGNNFTVTGNIIGYSSNTGTGIYALEGNSSTKLIPIFISVGTSTASNVNTNTITQISVTGALSGTSSSGAFRGIYISSGLAICNDNIIGNQTGTNSIVFNGTSTSAADVIGIFNFGSSNWVTNGNIIGGITGNNSSTGAVNIYGLRCNTGSGVTWQCENNIVGGTVANSIQSSTTSTSTVVNGILNSNPIGTFTNNIVRNLTSAGGTGTGASASISGIVSTSSASQTFTRNKIYTLVANGATSVYGLNVTSSGAAVNIVNNIIGDLQTPSSSVTDAIRGISFTTTSSSSALNVYYNTIYLNATSTGTNFGSSGIFHTFNTTATTASLTLRNNIVVNNSTANGTGLTVAFRRSAATNLNNFNTASNNNLYYAGTPSASNLVFYDGTNLDQTLADYKARVAPRESESVTENSPFASTNGADADFLHFAPATSTLAESAGANISGITTDYDNDIRQGNPGYTGTGAFPDLGADEFEGNNPTFVALDMSVDALVAPVTNGCYTATQSATLRVKNSGTATIDFAVNPVTVTLNITGAATATLTEVISTGSLAPQATQDVVFATTFDMSAAGTYTFNGSVAVTGDGNTTNDNLAPAVSITNTPLGVTAAASPASLCISGSATLTATATGGSTPYSYSLDGGTPQAGNTFNTGSISSTTAYTIDVTDACGVTASTPVTVTVDNPQVTSTTPGTECGASSVTLSATGSAGSTLNWYAAASGGTPLASGNTFNTPVIGSTTTYYVSAGIGSSSSNVSKLAPEGASTGTNLATYAQVFTVTTGFTLNSVQVFSTTGSSITVALYNSTGTTQLMSTGAVAVTPGTSPIIPIGWYIPPGTYRLGVPAMTLNFIRDNTGVTYPFALGSVGTMSGFVSSFTGTVTTTSSYYFLYNWSISVGCESARTAVTATITPAPSITASTTNNETCAGESTTLNVTSANDPDYTYTWDNGGGTGASVNVNPTVTTTYTVTAVDNSAGPNAGCTTSDQVTITVNPLPATPVMTPSSATLCPGDDVELTASSVGAATSSGTIGTGSLTSTLSSTGAANFPNVFAHYYGGNKHQMLFTAAELTAIGLTAGDNISAIGFNVASVNRTDELQSYEVKMGHTSLTALSTLQTGLTVVRNAAAYTTNTTPGLNTINFDTPFAWNGTSNIIIETSYSNNDQPDAGNVTMTYSTTTGVHTLVYRADLIAPATMNSYTGAVTYSLSQRPNTTIFVSNPINHPITWSPATGLSATTGNTVTANPSVTTTYTATATDAEGCTSTADVTVTVNTPSVNISGTNEICAGGSTLLTATATGTTVTYQWLLNGSAISGETASTYNATATGDYTVAIVSDGCEDTSAIFTVGYTQIQITASAGANGSINPSGTVNVDCGTNASFTIVADAGYQVDDVLVDGISQGAITSYNFINVTAPHTISVTFDVSTCSTPATADAGTNATICNGDFTLAGSIGGAATTATWSTSGTGTFNPSNVFGTAVSYTPSPADYITGNITLTLTTDDPDGAGSCVPAVANMILTAAASPDATPTANCTSLFTGSSALLTANANAGSGTITSYQWNLNTNPIPSANGATYTTPVNGAGSYTVTVTNSNGCSFTSTPIVITNISGPLSGTYYIGSACGFSSIASAAAYANANGISDDVIFEVPANWTETAPVGGITLGSTLLNGTLSSTQTITFRKDPATSGANPLITAYVGTSTSVDGIFKLAGTDYVTIDGIDLIDNNPTGVANMEAGYALVNLNGTAPFDGCQFVTIQNCVITLNRLNPNASNGITSAHITTASTTGLVITAPSDAHSNNKFYGNTISNVSFGIFLRGFTDDVTPFALYGQNNDIGGNSPATGNTITNTGGNTAFNNFAIYAAGHHNTNISYNTVDNALGGVNSITTVYGIYAWGTGSTYTLNNNTVTVKSASNNTANFAYGIYSNSANSNMTVTNNTVDAQQLSGSAVPVAAIYMANSAVANITDNVVTSNQTVAGIVYGIFSTAVSGTLNVSDNNITVTRTGSAAAYGINHTTAGAVTIDGNTIAVSSTGTNSGVAGFIYNNALSSSISITGNTFSASTLSTTGTAYLIFNSNASPNSIVTNNQTSGTINKTGAGGSLYGYYNNGSPASGTVTISDNNFSNLTVTGATTLYGIWHSTLTTQVTHITENTITNLTGGTSGVFGISHSYGASGSTVSENTISGLSSTTGAVTGIQIGLNTASLGLTVAQNTITGLSTITSGTVAGIIHTNGTNTQVTGNIIHGISTNGTLIHGATLTGGSSTFTKNKIYNVTANNAAGIVNGIHISGGNQNINNNLVGDLKAPVTSSTSSAVNGINSASTAANTNLNIYFNTVRLSATSTGANFSTSALLVSTSATATSAALDLKNNIFVNLSGTGTTSGFASAYRRSSTTLTNFGSNSNNNLYFAGTPSASRLIFYDGTNSDQTLAAYKSRVTPRDQNAVTEDVQFLSVSGADADFLHINPATATVIEGGAIAIPSVTTDYDNDTRHAFSPDIGADEGNFIGVQPVIITLNMTPAGNQCVATARVITVTYSAPVTSSGLNYSYNGVAQPAITMTNSSGNTWTGTIPAATSPANAQVTWSVTGTDGTYNPTASGTPYQDQYLDGAVTTAVVDNATICNGGSAELSVSTLNGAPGTVAVGTATSNTQAGSPFRAGGGGNRSQYLYTAAELQAAGLTSGPFTSFSWTFTTASSGTLPNFSIKLGHTSATVLTATFLPAPSDMVYGPIATFTPINAVGVQTINFTTPFVWDGVSNLLIEICHDAPSPLGGSGNVASNVTSFNSVNQGIAATACATASGTIQTARPVITFGGILGTNYTNTMTWVWNPGSISGNPVTVTPSTTTSYTATGTDANGCVVTSNAVQVTVNPLPAAPTSAGSTQCGVGVPTAEVSSTSTGIVYNWYDASTGGTLIQSSTADTLTNHVISTTTTFYVSAYDFTTGCESGRTPVTVTVTLPDAVTATSDDSNVCPGTTVTLTVSQTGTTNTYIYSWTGPNLNSTSGAVVTATPVTAGTNTYIVTATDAGAGCVITDTVEVVLDEAPVILSAEADPMVICEGESTTLVALTGDIAAGTINIGGAGNGNIGGNNGNPYRSGNGTGNQIRNQILVLASELTAEGLSAGPLTSLGFTTTSASTGTVSNFTISIAHTNATVLNATFETATATTVFTQASFTPLSAGLNVHTFQTPFIWDGVSNILINTCQTNNISGTATVVTSTPGFNANNHASTSTTACSATSGTIVAARPIMQIGGQIGSSGPGNLNWTWNPGNISGNQITVSPTVTTTYTVTATDPVSGCTSQQSVPVTVNPLPADPTTTPSSQCGVGVPTASVSSNSGLSNPVFNWYDAATGGNLIQSSTSSTLTSYIISETTTLYVSELNINTGCESALVPVIITVTMPDSVALSVSAGPYCFGNTITLTAVNTGTTQNYSYSWSGTTGSGITTPVSGASVNITPTATGTYYYVLTANDGNCTYVDSIAVTFTEVPEITTLTASPQSICNGTSSVLSATSISAQPGNVAVGTNTTTVSTTGNPYRAGFGAGSDVRTQMLFLASELLAAGIAPGDITSLGITTNSATGIMSNFTIKMGTTALTAVTTTYTSGLTTVFSVPSFTPAVGLNTHILQTPFNWDGVSNIIIEICQTNSTTGTTVVQANSPGFAATLHAGGVGACTVATGTTFTTRPIVRFGAEVGTSVTNSMTWNWMPGNLSGPSVTVSPSATTNYTVTVTDPVSGCSATSNITVTVNPVPTAPLANDSTRCGFGNANASVTSTSGFANPVFNWYDAATGGTLIQSSVSNTLTAYNVSSTTTFYVTEVDINSGCESFPRAAVLQTVTQPDSVSASVDFATICQGQSITLTATQHGSTNVYNYEWTSAAGSGITVSESGSSITVTPTAAGTYTYQVVASDNGCGYQATVEVLVHPAAAPISAGTDQDICNGSNVTLNASGPGLIPTLRFTEVLWQVNAGTGPTGPSIPSFISSWYGTSTTWDMLEISNMGSGATNPEGVTIEIWNSTTGTAPTFSKTIPAGAAVMPSQGLMFVTFSGTAVTNDLVNNFYTSGSGQDNGSGTAAGVILRKNGIIIDAVAVNGFTFPTASGVTSAEWSGTIPSNSGLSGSKAISNDNNTAAGWANTSAASPATLGAFNSGLTANFPSTGNVTWTSIPPGFTASTPNATFGPLTDTTLFVAVFNNGTCTSSDTVAVNVFDSPDAPVLTVSTDTICVSGSTTLTITNPGIGITYQWLTSGSPTGPWTSISGATSLNYTTPVLAPVNGDSTVYYAAYASCGTSNDTSDVSAVFISVPAILSTTPGSRCGFGSVELQATSTSAATPVWYASATGGAPLGTGTTFNTPNINTTTTYYVAAINSGSTAATTGMPAALSTATSGSGTTAFGLVFDVYSPFTLNSVTVYPVSASSAAGTVTIDIIDGNNTILHTATANVTGSPGGAVGQIIPLNFQVLPGTNLKMRPGFTGISGLLFEPSSSAPAGNYGYPYVVPGILSINTSTLTAAPANTPRNDLYYYFYNWQISTGCVSGRTPVVATVTAAPAISASATSTTICEGESTTLNATSANDPNYVYVWNGNLNGASQTVSPTVTTTYTVIATDTSASGNGCVNTADVVITVNDAPAVPVISQDPLVVCGGGPVTLSVPSVNSGDYAIGTGTTTLNTNGIAAFSAFWETTRLQHLYTAAELTAAGMVAGQITGIKVPVSSIGTLSFPYQDYTIRMGNTSATALTATWENVSTIVYGPVTQPVPVAGLNTITFATPFIWDGVSSIVMDICFSNDPSNTCTSCYNPSLSITVPTTTTATNTVHYQNNDGTTNCGTTATGTLSNARPNIQLTFDPSLTYLWSTGATTTSITVNPPTGQSSYTLTVTNPSGCTSSSTVTIDASQGPTPVITPGDTLLCSADVIYLHVIDTATYPGGYPTGTTVDWINIVNGLSPADSVASTNGSEYIVKVTLPNGCFGISDTVTVITRSVSVVETISPEACGNGNGSIIAEVTSVPAVGPYRFIWKDASNAVIRDIVTAASSDTLDNLMAGFYSLEVLDNQSGSLSCTSGSLVFEVEGSPGVIASIPTWVNSGPCVGLFSGSAQVVTQGGAAPLTYLWSNGETTSSISGLGGGTYTITVTDVLGCSDTAVVVISEPDSILMSYAITQPLCPGDANGSVTATVTGGTAPYSYTWYDENFIELDYDETVENIPAGEYLLFILDANGCDGVSTVVVTDPAPVSLTSFTPANGPVGTSVTITGVSFTGATAVQFNGTPATVFTVVNSTTITAQVPAGATTGQITVMTPCDTVVSSGIFTVDAGPSVALFNLHVLIEGYYSGAGQMTSALLNSGVGIDPNESDTLIVELRDQFSPTTVVSTDTTLLNINGQALFTFPSSVVGGSYYIVVLHRNAVQTWSALPVTFSSTTSYDFTTSSSQAYNGNMKEVEPGVWAMYSGDIAPQDEFIDLFDQIALDNDLLNGSSGYLPTDLNGDGFIDLFDQIILDNNTFNGVFSDHP